MISAQLILMDECFLVHGVIATWLDSGITWNKREYL